MVTKTVDFYMPDKAVEIIGSDKREKVLEGGRGSGKSYSFADALVVRAAREELRILCTRETQKSIKDSVHKLLSDRISALGLDGYFDIKKDTIRSSTGSEFIFKGLRHNITEIKSTEGIDICWVEEAEKVTADSWDVLIPTIRKEGSEIWVSFNQESKDSATRSRFIENPSPFCISAHMTYRDNKYFPDVLRQEMEYDRVNDPEKYEWVWEGGLKKYHDAVIFTKVFEEEFETPEGVDILFGCDLGFANDPLALVRGFIINRDLFIDYEFYAVGVENTELHAAFNTIPNIREGRIRADCSRPETISYLRGNGGRNGDIEGFDVIGEGKLKIEEGIQYLKGFERIVIHPRCKGTLDDFKNYRWKQDRLTKEILPVPVDKSNHSPDAVRYMLRPLISVKKWGAG
jgi:phage terminase large subunit